MNKIILTLTLIVSIALSACAKDEYSRNPNTLPLAARTTLKNNFKGKISVIKIDKDFGKVSDYEVILTDGSEVTFDRKGNWKDIESAPDSKVPAKLVPAAISKYVKENHGSARIIGIDKDRNGYEIELSNGLELKFNREGKFLRYDD